MIKLIYKPSGGWMHVYTPEDYEEHKKMGWTDAEIPAVEAASPMLQNVVVNNHDYPSCPHCGKKLGKRPDAHLRFCKGIVHGDRQ